MHMLSGEGEARVGRAMDEHVRAMGEHARKGRRISTCTCVAST